MNLNKWCILKAVAYMGIAAGFFSVGYAAGTPASGSLGDVATNVTSSFNALGLMITAISYLAGFAFSVASVFKLKQHKDNPQQVPVTTGIAMLAFGIGLIFMPSLVQMGGATLFTGGGVTAGTSGIACDTAGSISKCIGQ